MNDMFLQRTSIPRDVLVRELEGESVILNLKTETYFSLDNVGTSMWKALEANDTVQAAYQELLKEYDVDSETLIKDLQALIEQLVQNELLAIHPE